MKCVIRIFKSEGRVPRIIFQQPPLTRPASKHQAEELIEALMSLRPETRNQNSFAEPNLQRNNTKQQQVHHIRPSAELLADIKPAMQQSAQFRVSLDPL